MDTTKHPSPKFIYLSIFILCFFLTIPPFLNGHIVGHDIIYHINWNELFQTQLFQGDLYPRWLLDMKGGRGSPVFYFYSPLPYYCSALFSLLIPTTQSTWYSLGATFFFALVASGLGMFWFLRSYADDTYAYIYTIFYILFPYHIVVDLYIRFAFAEFFSIAWIPFIFIFIRRIVEDKKNSTWHMGIFYALMLLSHIPTTLLMTPFIIVFGIINARKKSHRYFIIAGLSLGVALSAFYLLPIIYLKEFVSIERMTTGNLSYDKSFLFADRFFITNTSLLRSFLGNLSIATIIIIFSTFFSAPKNKNSIFYFIAGICCIFMMSPFSLIIWELIPILQIIQFPWRFNIVLSFTIFYGSVFYSNSKKTMLPLTKYSIFLAITILTSTSAITIFHSYYNATNRLEDNHRAILTKKIRDREGVPEYLPVSTPEFYYNQEIERVNELLTGTQKKVKFEYRFQGSQIIVSVTNPQPQNIRLNQFHFPTWEGYSIEGDNAFEISRSKDGFIEFHLDKGTHSLLFKHKKTTSEIFGGVISLIVAGVVLLRILTIFRRNNWKSA